MAFDVVTIKEEFTHYDDISAGTLFSPVSDPNNFYLKLMEYEIEDFCETCEAHNVVTDYDACVEIRTGVVTKFNPITDCIVYTQSELKLSK